ncbi:hypothetical protein A0130_07820 [Leifsonia xyli]|uniref:hypothetical protein n=1 Tax=Leifsonia xyli TaxID=1575 RepID=UPI0007CDA4B0|nr:hypothetical protein A0130_07820 [Leifsonia xyli]
MDFFPPDPPEDELEPPEIEQDPRWNAPVDEVPAIVPIGEALAVTDTVAIVVSHARVFQNGVEIVIDRRSRRGDRSRREWEERQWSSHASFPGGDTDRLRYGMALGDGQHLLLDGPGWNPDEKPAEAHSLAPTGGGGSGGPDYTVYLDAMWLYPLRPEGPLEIVTQWPAEGIPESRVVLDGGALRARAADSRKVWE